MEFALVTPLLLLLLIGCLDFSRALNAYVTVANAAREGARFASLDASADSASVKAFLAGRVAPLDSDAITVSVAFVRPSDVRWNTSAPVQGEVTVSVSYPWDSTTWLVGRFFSASGVRTFTSAASAGATR